MYKSEDLTHKGYGSNHPLLLHRIHVFMYLQLKLCFSNFKVHANCLEYVWGEALQLYF